MSMSIWGLATAQPPFQLSRSEAVRMAEGLIGGSCPRSMRAVDGIYRRTHVDARSMVILDGDRGYDSVFFYHPAANGDDRGPTTAMRMQQYVRDAVVLAEQAARQAIETSGVAHGDFTHLVTISCTGFNSPGVDIQLIERLGLPPTIARLNVGFMGCHAAINGLRAAMALAGTRPDARVLMCAVELCSLHYQYRWESDKTVANALFGDGAAALVGAPTIGSNGRPCWKAVDTATRLLPPESRDAMTWIVGDHGFEMTLSPHVPEYIGQHLRGWLETWLARHDLTIDQIGSWAVHPGGPRVVDSVAETLDLPLDVMNISRQVLAECGNMSSPTVLFIVERLQQTGAPLPCVALAFGPGLTAEGALFK